MSFAREAVSHVQDRAGAAQLLLQSIDGDVLNRSAIGNSQCGGYTGGLHRKHYLLDLEAGRL